MTLVPRSTERLLPTVENHLLAAHETRSKRNKLQKGYFTFIYCVRCGRPNATELLHFRYCRACFTIRKAHFPPAPKPKQRKFKCQSFHHSVVTTAPVGPIESSRQSQAQAQATGLSIAPKIETSAPADVSMKRKLEAAEMCTKDDPESDLETQYPAKKIALEKTKLSNTIDGPPTATDLCSYCLSAPRNCAFLHNGFAHLCCCYPCGKITWNTLKRCPLCNLRTKNIIKIFQ